MSRPPLSKYAPVMERIWECLGGDAYGMTRTYKPGDVRLGGDALDWEYADMRRALRVKLPPGPWRIREGLDQNEYEVKLLVWTRWGC